MTKAKRRKRNKAATLEALTIQTNEWERRRGKAPPRGQRELLQQYRGWAHHCANINATNVASATLRLFVAHKGGAKHNGQSRHKQYASQHGHVRKAVAASGGDYEEVLSHPVLDVLGRPNRAMSSHEFWRLVELWLGLVGNCYIWEEPGPLGVPAGLWLIPPIGMKLVPGATEVLDGYIYSPNGVRKVAYTADEIIHIRRPNPLDPYFYGLGDAASEPEILYLSGAIDEWELSSMRNSARPDGLLESDEAVSKDDARRLRVEWRHIYGGPGNVGKIAILQGGLKFKAISWNPKDVQTLEGDKRCMKRIASAFGVPMSMLTAEDINRANADAGERQYARQTLRPRLTNYAAQLTEEWAVQYDPRLFLLFDDPVPQERLLDARIADIYIKNDTWTVNEVREGQQKPAVEWGDDPASSRKPAPPQFGSSPEPPAKTVGRMITKRVDGTLVKAVDDSGFITAMQGVFRRQEQQLLGSDKGAEEELAAEQFRERLDAVKTSWVTMTGEAAIPHITEGVVGGSAEGLAKLETMGVTVDTSWAVTNPEVAKFVKDYIPKLAGEITEESRRRIMDAVGRGLKEGRNTFEIRNMIREQFDGFIKYRANMIARTEASRANHAGEVEAWKKSGVVTRKIWQANADACEYCQTMHGAVVSIESNYAELGDSVSSADPNHPGATMPVTYAAVETPPLHPQCQCYLLPEVSEV